MQGSRMGVIQGKAWREMESVPVRSSQILCLRNGMLSTDFSVKVIKRLPEV